MDNPEPNPPPPTGDKAFRFVCMLLGLPTVLFGGALTLLFSLFLFLSVADRIGGGPPLADLPRFLVIWLFLGAAA